MTRPVETDTGSEFRFTGKHMLIIMIVFFAVIVGVNFTMATLASRSWTGLVVKNSYVASQGYNDELAASDRQKVSGWQSTLYYQDDVLQITVVDRDGRSVLVETAEVMIGRPAFEQQDQRLAMTLHNDGSATAGINLAPGIWAVEFVAESRHGTYRRNARLLVDDKGRGWLE